VAVPLICPRHWGRLEKGQSIMANKLHFAQAYEALKSIDREWAAVPEKWLTIELEQRFADQVSAISAKLAVAPVASEADIVAAMAFLAKESGFISRRICRAP